MINTWSNQTKKCFFSIT